MRLSVYCIGFGKLILEHHVVIFAVVLEHHIASRLVKLLVDKCFVLGLVHWSGVWDEPWLLLQHHGAAPY